jgi:chromosome segregation ATPase
MARGVKAKAAEPVRRARKLAPPSKAKAKVAAAKKSTAAATPSVTPRAISKDALRAQAEKLERANTALRTKNREANRAAKLSAARMAELEDEVARLQTQLAAMSAQPTALPDNGSPTRAIEPGDAVPPGVAPADPEPADSEAEIGRENLEAHLRGE